MYSDSGAEQSPRLTYTYGVIRVTSGWQVWRTAKRDNVIVYRVPEGPVQFSREAALAHAAHLSAQTNGHA
jgi:hypothetical protein